MFTGIIEYLGILTKKEGSKFTFKTPPTFCSQLHPGVSVAINGVCLTTVAKASDTFSTEVIPETLKKTMLGKLKKDGLVNLELPVTPKTFLSGHIVQGHIDGLGQVINITENENGKIIKLSYPNSLDKYLVEKGSIAINGISLTIISVSRGLLTIGIIPYTFNHTMMQQLEKNDLVNIEVDVLAKYVEKILCIN